MAENESKKNKDVEKTATTDQDLENSIMTDDELDGLSGGFSKYFWGSGKSRPTKFP